jgi:hypothetical protein
MQHLLSPLVAGALLLKLTNHIINTFHGLEIGQAGGKFYF